MKVGYRRIQNREHAASASRVQKSSDSANRRYIEVEMRRTLVVKARAATQKGPAMQLECDGSSDGGVSRVIRACM